jgi:hypothetical protein
MLKCSVPLRTTILRPCHPLSHPRESGDPVFESGEFDNITELSLPGRWHVRATKKLTILANPTT